ncbi:hypothetical protein DXG01_014598 [Tephrocybe rancida]|nr:hypothetical protein DXG01_014598 [Tephrocybe rancida]
MDRQGYNRLSLRDPEGDRNPHADTSQPFNHIPGLRPIRKTSRKIWGAAWAKKLTKEHPYKDLDETITIRADNSSHKGSVSMRLKAWTDLAWHMNWTMPGMTCLHKIAADPYEDLNEAPTPAPTPLDRVNMLQGSGPFERDLPQYTKWPIGSACWHDDTGNVELVDGLEGDLIQGIKATFYVAQAFGSLHVFLDGLIVVLGYDIKEGDKHYGDSHDLGSLN